jgi:thioredoxin 1
MLAPVLAELEQEYSDVKFCKINVDNDRELAMEFNVTSIPMVAFVKNNVFADVSVGFVPKENLVKLIEANK